MEINDVKIIVMYDKDCNISAVKVNNYLFFRNPSESILTFFNEVIIPDVAEHGIDFVKHYKKKNITEIYQANYKSKKKDEIFLEDRQIGNILKASSIDELDYAERFYVLNLFRNKFNKEYVSNDENFEIVQDIIFEDISLDVKAPRDVEDVIYDYFDDDSINCLLDDQPKLHFGGYFGSVKNRLKVLSESLKEIRKGEDSKDDEVEDKETESSEEKSNEINSNIKNQKIYLNKCRDAVMSGKQIGFLRSRYSQDNMYGASNKGNFSSVQEDSYIILEHPKNKNLKLLAIADGTSVLENGDVISNYVIKKLIKWFEKLNDDINDMDELKIKFSEFLPTILNDIDTKEVLDSETTLSGAVVGEEETLIFNVGNSKVYSVTNDSLVCETNQLGEVGKISKEMISEPDYNVVKNSEYDKIVAVSTGVSDSLSHDELQNCINSAETGKIAEKIIYDICKNKGENDNVSAVVYVRK